ncbi:MAG: hypothetical protein ACTHKK_00840, partial [Candidatus Nitrosocosmicus sp.]
NGKEEIKSFSDNNNKSMDIKETKFKELIEQLQKWGYKVVDRSKENKIEGIQFKAEVTPLLDYSSGVRTPFFLEFQNDVEDGFVLRSTFELDKNIELHLKNQNRSRELELTYIQIEQIVLPLRVSLMRAHPSIYLYKVIFLEGLTKQFFYDSINALVNAMALIISKWDEKYYEMKPKDNEVKPDKDKNI